MGISTVLRACAGAPCLSPNGFLAAMEAQGTSNTPWGIGLAYLVATLLFILALRALSRPESAQRGNFYGMAGMALAVGATVVIHDASSLPVIGLALAIGGTIGLTIAVRVTAATIPQLMAAFHSLAGLAALLMGIAGWLDPDSFGIALTDGCVNVGGATFSCGPVRSIAPASAAGLMLGTAMSALAFTGSIIALLKLSGIMGDRPGRLPARRGLNGAAALAILTMAALSAAGYAPNWLFGAVVALSLPVGALIVIPIDRTAMPVVLPMLSSCSGWAAVAMGLAFQNMPMVVAGALVGSFGVLLSHRLCRAMDRGLLSMASDGKR